MYIAPWEPYSNDGAGRANWGAVEKFAVDTLLCRAVSGVLQGSQRTARRSVPSRGSASSPGVASWLARLQSLLRLAVASRERRHIAPRNSAYTAHRQAVAPLIPGVAFEA